MPSNDRERLCAKCGEPIRLLDGCEWRADEDDTFCVECLDVMHRELANTLAAIRHDIPSLHQRRCHGCGKTHWHADNRTPYVCCQECKSQDTRRVKP